MQAEPHDHQGGVAFLSETRDYYAAHTSNERQAIVGERAASRWTGFADDLLVGGDRASIRGYGSRRPRFDRYPGRWIHHCLLAP